MVILDATGITGDNPTYFTEYIDFKYSNTDVYTFSLLTSDGHISIVTGTFVKQNIKNEGSFSLAFGPSSTGARTGFTQIRVNAGRSIGLVAAKLELGPVQTLAHQDADGNWILNDPPPNKAMELAKCQRYQVVYLHTLNTVAVGFASNTTSVLVKISCPPLRAIPTLNFERLYLSSGAYAGTNSIPVTDVTDVFGDNGSYYVQFKCAGGLTVGEAVLVQLRGGHLILDVNL